MPVQEDTLVMGHTKALVYWGSRQEVVQYLKDHPSVGSWHAVIEGDSSAEVSIVDYMARYGNTSGETN